MEMRHDHDMLSESFIILQNLLIRSILHVTGFVKTACMQNSW